MIMNRRTFEYKLRHVFQYYLRCFACRSKSALRNIKEAKRDLYFDSAEKKLMRHLDISYLLQIIRDAAQTQATLFNKNSRMLLRLNRATVVTATSSEDGEEIADKYNERI